MSDEKFYILDVRSVVGNCAMFWRPQGAGYTTQLEAAGLYSEEEARSHRETDIAWSAESELARLCSRAGVARAADIELSRVDALDAAGVKWPRVKR